MKKILIIGSPGAGKSSFARRLRDELSIPLFHLDMIWYRSDRTTVSREQFEAELREIVKKDSWILDGNYGRTLEMRLIECDTVFLLDLPTDVCLSGAESRIGRKREDLPWVEEELDAEFRQWIVDFPKDQLPAIYALLEKYKYKNITVFKSREEIDNYRIKTT